MFVLFFVVVLSKQNVRTPLFVAGSFVLLFVLNQDGKLSQDLFFLTFGFIVTL